MTSRRASADDRAVGFDRAEAPGVAVEDLTKRYGQVGAVDGVSLTIPRGQIFGLLGPNSAGKTTLIEGIRTPDSGSVSVLGLRYRDSAKEIKTRTGVQLQKTGFYDRLSLRETLELYASFYPEPLDVDELMTRLQIREKAKTRVKDLSGGILQRMSLGVALVNDPELVLLDEPTTGLDPQARHVIWEAVRSLAAEGTTVMLTTHYMDEAEQLCDQVAVLTAGRIRAQGSPSDLIRRYVGESVVEIASAEDLDDAAARAILLRRRIPGLTAGLAVTVPYSVLVLSRLHRRGYLQKQAVVHSTAVGVAAMAPALVGLRWLARRLL